MAYATSRANAVWPEGILPFVIQEGDFSPAERNAVLGAIDRWNLTSIIRLVARGTEPDFVTFRRAEDSCSSNVGRVGGEQFVGCAVGEGFDEGNVMHEIGHAVGFYHEHQRPDRDQFVRIVEDNIVPGRETAFTIIPGGILLGPYDFESIMHYGRKGFSTGGDTIQPLQDVEIGQRVRLSTEDLRGVCTLYHAPDFVVAWSDDQKDTGRAEILWAPLVRWGKRCGIQQGFLEAAHVNRSWPSIGLDALGNSVVVWQEASSGLGPYRVRAHSLAADGGERFPEVTIADGSRSGLAVPQVAVDGAGGFVVVWQEVTGSGQRVMARAFDALAQPRIDAVPVATSALGIPGGPVVDLSPDGGFVVAWGRLVEESLSVHARAFDAAGRARTPEITVDSRLGDQDVSPRLGVAGDGGFVVVYNDSLSEVKARGFHTDGTERFGARIVNSFREGWQHLPDVAVATDGSFVVVWGDDRNENRMGQIRARGFDADGNETVPDRTINPRGGGHQERPRIARAGGGRLYVVWEDDEDRNGVFQVHAVGLDAVLGILFDAVTVNIVSVGQQVQPAVAAR